MSEKQINEGHAARTRGKVNEIKSELRSRVKANPSTADEEMKKAQKRLQSLLGK